MRLFFGILFSVFVLAACQPDTATDNAATTKAAAKTPEKVDTFVPPNEPDKLKDYLEALDRAETQKKPLLAYFTAYRGCKLCPAMEKDMLQNPKVKKFIDDNFIFAYLYVDDPTPLQEIEFYENEDGKMVKTRGARLLDLQKEDYRSTNRPEFYVVNENEYIFAASAYETDPEQFIKFLEAGLKSYTPGN